MVVTVISVIGAATLTHGLLRVISYLDGGRK